jgi:hypothetical protein
MLLAGHNTNRCSLAVDFCTLFKAHVHDFTRDSGNYSVTAVLNSSLKKSGAKRDIINRRL